MNWDDLRYALAVADAGSLSAAAAKMGVNASTVLRRIAALEHAAGVRLFDRDQTGYQLTREGAGLIAALGPIQDRIEGIVRGFAPDAPGNEAVVRMAAPSALAHAFIAPRLHQFRALHPQLSIQISVTDGAAPEKLGTVDLALIYGRPAHGDMLIRKLAQVGYGLYGVPELLARHRVARPELNLAGLPVIGFAEDDLSPGPAEWLASAGRQGLSVLRSSNASCRFAAALSGLGFAALPCFLAADVTGLTRVCGPEIAGSVELWLASHKQVRHMSRLQAVADFLVELARDRRERLAGLS